MNYLTRDDSLSPWLIAAILFMLASYCYTLIWGWI